MSAVAADRLDGRRPRGRRSVPHDLAGPAPRVVVDESRLLPPRAKEDGTVRRMLLSALVLFGERGYHAVPVREIARGAGMRASSMYEHRAGKEDLLLDLMRIGHEEHHQALVDALEHAGDTPQERIAALVRAHVRVHAAYPVLTRVCNRELQALSPERLAPAIAVRQAATALLTGIIEDGVRAGVFDVPDAYAATAAIGAMGIRVAEWYTPDAHLSVDELADVYAVFALRLLGCPDAVPSGEVTARAVPAGAARRAAAR